MKSGEDYKTKGGEEEVLCALWGTTEVKRITRPTGRRVEEDKTQGAKHGSHTMYRREMKTAKNGGGPGKESASE